MTDDTPLLSRFELAAAALRARGVTLTRLPGQYSVNFRPGRAELARFADDLDGALELGRAMADDAPTAPRRRRRPLRMTPKAIRRRMIRAHNHRTRARAIKRQDDAL